MRRVPEMWDKIKPLLDETVGEWGILALVLLVSLGSFGLGRLSVLEAGTPLIRLQEAPQAASAGPLMPGGVVVASRSGEVYYFPWCAGAARIALENRRTFSSAQDAQRAGYRAAKNCKGLE